METPPAPRARSTAGRRWRRDRAPTTLTSGADTTRHGPRGTLAMLTVGALGIVYGDIGTSPLYAMDQLFLGRGAETVAPADVLGGVSLVIWTITVIVAIKYATLVLRAQNDGEGGVFALYALLHDRKRRGTRVLLWALMLGAGLLFGDGIITPAISVLSAVEGLSVATPALQSTVVPVTLALLTGLFAIQFKGTAGIGTVFGPVLGLWFVVIAALGGVQIVAHPQILAAFNPLYGLAWLAHTDLYESLLVLGALILVVTGGEAMYADVGHFGTRPIQLSWFGVVFPALLLNYLGQGAYLLGGAPVVGGKLFYSLVPQPLLYPMVLLATVATVIASQALISGAFSLVAQAIRLGLFPRIALLHTHEAHAGQIYVPFINWALYLGCVALVLGFGSSSALASAYGLAVAGVMLITSLAMFPVARRLWNWSRPATVAVWSTLTVVNAAFLGACSLKFVEGGYVPFTIGVTLFAVMATWRWGRKATFAAYSAKATMTMAELVELHRSCETFMERNAVVMSPRSLHLPTDRAPALMHMLWERHGILPRNLVLVEVTHRKAPYVHEGRYNVTVFDRDRARGSVIGVEISFGFMEEPNVERLLEDMARHREIDLPTDRRRWVVHASQENLIPTRRMNWLRRLRLRVFLLLRMVSQPAYYYYGLGDELQLSVEIIPVRVN
ncbi:MAG: KUP/HAK/KT family potassium transporter [Xanthobacteraceae bacterium]|nr:KUP/HAK/KT family potassium transporter [Xanthobacteraceae bacterium]